MTLNAVCGLTCCPPTTGPGEVNCPGPEKVNTPRLPLIVAWKAPSTPVAITTGFSKELVTNTVSTLEIDVTLVTTVMLVSKSVPLLVIV